MPTRFPVAESTSATDSFDKFEGDITENPGSMVDPHTGTSPQMNHFSQSLSSANWTFSEADAANAAWLKATIPGCVHQDLLAHNAIPDPFYGRNELDVQWIEERDWLYRAEFTPAAELFEQEEVDLVFGGLDTVADVKLNGVHILHSENMFHSHRIGVKNLLKAGETNLLEITFGSAMKYIREMRPGFKAPEFNDPVGGSTKIRKMQCNFGWDWGPRLVTCGVWLPATLQGWSVNRLETVAVKQHHATPGSGPVSLTLSPALTRENKAARYRATLSLKGEAVSSFEGTLSPTGELTLNVAQPQLWWPAGQGAQPLYDLEVSLLGEGNAAPAVSTWKQRIGLRTIVLDRDADEFTDVTGGPDGQTLTRFGLRVNGRLVFAKGANWIPAHSFVAGLSFNDYEPLLQAMIDANMNLIRLWGGGIYEHDVFYDICDEKGLLVWNDFMFACTHSPGDADYVTSVRREATEQVTRIRHHASLALWCGNNEVTALNQKFYRDNPEAAKEYLAIFIETLPAVLRETDPVTSYIHSSPCYPLPGFEAETRQATLDEHDWKVWHSLAPVSHYETTRHRFCSEFGMQSYPSQEIAETFCPADELNVFSPTFEVHQKNSGGNQTIFNYASRLYKFPKDYRAVAYQSQLNQAYCMKTAVEHFRRQSPQCLGAVYWQVNDCWPVASWSGLEFGGKWKALHHEARRFFAPALVSFHHLGEEKRGIGNYIRNTRGAVEVYALYDGPTDLVVTLRWKLIRLDGTEIQSDSASVELQQGRGLLWKTLDFSTVLDKEGRQNVVLMADLLDTTGTQILASNTTYFDAPRFLKLQTDPIQTEWQPAAHEVSSSVVKLKLKSKTLHYRVCLELEGCGVWWSDNYFDLLPNEDKWIEVRFPKVCAPADLEKLQVYSLIHSY
ncbi:MAG TPA: glycoside hydrolase family 2 protein [Candidatus Methylacidiphilales bacterium]|nr:glycoside hydrolase family 2 protein [Candidatus Methylacidiphilales bacterium]